MNQGKKNTKGSGTLKHQKSVPALPKKALKQVDLGVIRERITNLVGNHALNMVETTIKEVDKGHYLAMKYLFEMVGLCSVTAPEDAPQEDSLAKTLLRRLRFPEETNPVAEVTKEVMTDSPMGEMREESDALK
jgi:hypothetical protein